MATQILPQRCKILKRIHKRTKDHLSPAFHKTLLACPSFPILVLRRKICKTQPFYILVLLLSFTPFQTFGYHAGQQRRKGEGLTNPLAFTSRTVSSHSPLPQFLLNLFTIVSKMTSVILLQSSDEMVNDLRCRCPHCQNFKKVFEEAAIKAQASRVSVFFAKVLMRLRTTCGLSLLNVFFFFPLV